MKHITSFLVLLLIATTSFSKGSELKKSQFLENYGKIPLSFTANAGQLYSQVKFTTKGNGAAMFFTQEGTTIILSRETEESIAKRTNNSLRKEIHPDEANEPFNRESEREMEYFALKKYFVGANPNPEVVGEDRLSWNNNYFIGNDPDKWQTDVPNYAKVRLKNLYEGIDLLYYGNKNRIKYDFVVQPGEDPRKIVLTYDFGNTPHLEASISVNKDDELVVKTPLGNITEQKPYCYQVINGEEIEVEVNYKIIDGSLNTFTFSIGKYDKDYPLIIDPELVYSTHLGGSDFDNGRGISIDASGCAYVTGYTLSSNFPVTSGAYDESHNGNEDVFVCKFSFGEEIPNSIFFEDEKQVTKEFEVHQNFPNPFNPITTIEFQIPKSSFVTLKIYNILGQEIKTLVIKKQSPGIYQVKWDGTNNYGIKVNSGIYIYRIKTNTGYVKSRKMLFLK